MFSRVVGPVIALALFCIASPAQAHLGSVKYIRVMESPGGGRVAIELDAVDASMQLGLGEEVDRAAVDARRLELTTWINDGIRFHQGGARCEVTADGGGWMTRDGRPYMSFEFVFSCPQRDGGLRISDQTVFDDDPQHEAFVYLDGSGTGTARVLRATAREAEISGDDSAVSQFVQFSTLGVIHLWTGYDHVLFLLCLLLGVGRVIALRGTRAGLRDALVLVTAFTIGHSITLGAAALRWVVLPSAPVEFVIALSIAVAAATNLYRPEARRAAVAIAAGFGLVHGFGFSSVLAEFLRDADGIVVPLLAFNLGIEVGQLVIALVLWWPLLKLASWDGYTTWGIRGGSFLIMIVALYWMVERSWML